MSTRSGKILVTLSVLLLLLLFLVYNPLNATIRSTFTQADGRQIVGFLPVNCWFTPEPDWPVTECYYMQVPENHAKPDGRGSAVPVVVVRSRAIIAYTRPVLLLGAGGPGARALRGVGLGRCRHTGLQYNLCAPCGWSRSSLQGFRLSTIGLPEAGH